MAALIVRFSIFATNILLRFNVTGIVWYPYGFCVTANDSSFIIGSIDITVELIGIIRKYLFINTVDFAIIIAFCFVLVNFRNYTKRPVRFSFWYILCIKGFKLSTQRGFRKTVMGNFICIDIFEIFKHDFTPFS